MVVFKILANLLILSFDMLKVLLSSVEIMLIFSAVVSPITENKIVTKELFPYNF